MLQISAESLPSLPSAPCRWECVFLRQATREKSNRFQSPLQFTQFGRQTIPTQPTLRCLEPKKPKKTPHSLQKIIQSPRNQTLNLLAASPQLVIMHKFPSRLHLRVTFPSESLHVPSPSSIYCRSSHHPLLRSLADVWHVVNFSSNVFCQWEKFVLQPSWNIKRNVTQSTECISTRQ